MCLSLRREGPPPARVRLELRARRERELGQVLWRKVSDVDGGTQCWQLGDNGLPVPDSRQLWLALRSAGPAADARAVRVPVTGTKTLTQEQLIAGDEVWGDLSVRLQSRAATRGARKAWPEWLPVALVPSPWMALVLTAGLWSGALLAAWQWLPVLALIRWTAPELDRWRRLGVVIAAALTLIGGACAWWLARKSDGLIDELAHARVTTTARYLGEAVAVVDVDLGDGRTRALFTLPTTAVEWDVPDAATTFATAIALRQEAWTLEGDGASFAVLARYDAEQEAVLYSKHLDPYRNAAERRWEALSIDLAALSRRPESIALLVTAGPNGNAVLDAAMWREPRFEPTP